MQYVKGLSLKKTLFLMVIFFINPNVAKAICWTGEPMIVGNSRNETITIPVNSNQTGQVLGSITDVSIFKNNVMCDNPVAGFRVNVWTNSAGKSFNRTALVGGQQVAVFNTGFQGIGYALKLGAVGHGQFTFLQERPLQITPLMTMRDPFTVQASYVYVITAPLKPGRYDIGSTVAGTFNIWSEKTLKDYPFLVTLPPATINVVAQSCTLGGAVREQVNFGNITQRIIKGGDIGVTLDRKVTCPPSGQNISVFFTLADGNFENNRGTYLKNKVGSDYAAGVGVEVSLDGKPINLGPRSSVAGVENQIPLGKGSQQFTLTAKPVIIPNEEYRAGKLDATAILTMSYQ